MRIIASSFVACTLSSLFLVAPAVAQKNPNSWNQQKQFHTYTQISGAARVGPEQCATCHSDQAKEFQHAYHAQQGVQCEDCHGYGSLHVAGGGDISKIITFSKRPASAANGVCLSCHARDAKVRYWMAGSHSANRVRCIDCHQIHATAARAAAETRISFDTSTDGAFAAETAVPEANVIVRPPAQTNEACLTCHPTEKAQLSMPYHHPLREGKMSCVDCHDPHGGPAGNNLRTANVNQLCLSCHAQYRGPFAYQHPPVTENCLTCHNSHGSPNTNLLSVSMPALCLQCHASHHNGASLPLDDRCTNCHGSIHGTDVATPSGGSRFVDKGPYGVPAVASQTIQPLSTGASATRATSSAAALPTVASHTPAYALGMGSGALGMMSGIPAPLSGGSMQGAANQAEAADGGTYSVSSFTPGAYRFVDGSGFLGRVGEYDTLQQSAGADAVNAYVSPQNHLSIVSRANFLTGDDYNAASQLTAGQWVRIGFNMRSFVQQQDTYPFYAGVMSPDLLPITNLIPAHAVYGVKRRLGNAQGQVKLPKLPVHLFVSGNWQARAGASQLAYLDENTTATCGELCHYNTRLQQVNYTTRNIGGGADVDLGPVRLTYQHTFSSFTDRLVFPVASYGPFTPADEPPPPPVAVPPAVAPGNYYLDIPAPNQASTDSVSLNWTASPRLSANGHASYTRLRDTLTNHPQNDFDTDENLNWHPTDRLRLTADYHQHNLLNDFTPFYALYGNVSYHRHSEGLRAEYELPAGLNAEVYYQHGGITRSNAALWPQVYSFDNTDLLRVVPSSTSDTTGLALRYHDHGHWGARTGYEWTGTDNPGYLIIPQSNNRVFADVTLTPINQVVFTNDLSVIVQNAFPAIPLTNISGAFQRRNRFYVDTASATLRPRGAWNLGLGYSYQQNNLATYMAFQNDIAAGYVLDEPLVPYKQITQTYWGESSYTVKQRLGLNLRITYNSARSGFRPDLNASNPGAFGNAALIAGSVPGLSFDPVLFGQALGNLQLAATQVSQVIVPQWIGQSKAYYVFPRKVEGGLTFDYGSYRDYWNPNLNGVLRTFNLYVGRSW